MGLKRSIVNHVGGLTLVHLSTAAILPLMRTHTCTLDVELLPQSSI